MCRENHSLAIRGHAFQSLTGLSPGKCLPSNLNLPHGALQKRTSSCSGTGELENNVRPSFIVYLKIGNNPALMAHPHFYQIPSFSDNARGPTACLTPVNGPALGFGCSDVVQERNCPSLEGGGCLSCSNSTGGDASVCDLAICLTWHPWGRWNGVSRGCCAF